MGNACCGSSDQPSYMNGPLKDLKNVPYRNSTLAARVLDAG